MCLLKKCSIFLTLMKKLMDSLPVNDIRHILKQHLSKNSCCIICAPPGSGKSTLVPQFVYDDNISGGKTVIVLQPRRMASRMLAKYIAVQRNSMLGEEVGYIVRLENQHSKNTRILFLTEGILLNRLFQNDSLEEVGAIIFDEFHERHLETDLSLALSLELQKTIRQDLKLIIMSATLDIEQVKNILPDGTSVIESKGRAFPVDIRYSQSKTSEPVWEHAARQLETMRSEFKDRNALVFMPGSYEISKTIEAIQKRQTLGSYQILALHGSLTKELQDRAVEQGTNKIIVSTNVAETSLTIPGVSLVIDSGLARVPRFDSRRGVNTLFVENISTSSADQRAGRAGRLGPGTCIRLWGEFENAHRVVKNMPEIFRLDLSEVILNLISLGYSNPKNFPWIEKPEEKSIEKALELLQNLGAVDKNCDLTELGKKMSEIGVHPRYARMLLKANELECLPTACIAVAIAQSSGIITRSKDPIIAREQEYTFGNPGSDLLFELNAWIWARQQSFKNQICSSLGVNARSAGQITILALQLLRKATILNYSENSFPNSFISYDDEIKLRECIFTGFIDFIAVKHRNNSPLCQMLYGKSARLHPLSIVKESRFMVAIELEESKINNSTQLSIRKASKVEEQWLSELVTTNVLIEKTLIYDYELKKVVEREKHIFNDLVIFQKINEASNPEKVSELLTQLVLKGELKFENWDEEVVHFINRANFAALNAPQFEIPKIDNEAIYFIMQQSLYKCKSEKDLEKTTPWPSLKSWFSPSQLISIDYLAPLSVNLPHRKYPVKLRYNDKGDAILSETVQALYDCPPIMLCEGKVQVVYEILAPSRRPVQITRDLEQFWKGSYQDVKKELKGRYPKHEWR